VRFWDSSAIVPLLIYETTTTAIERLVSTDPLMLVWWPSAVECASALSRLEREDVLDHSGATDAFDRLKRLSERWHVIDPSDAVREAAIRFLRVHPLRASDALQLAAAFVASDRRPSSLEVITLDDRLALAARKEGFAVIEVPTS
jgi:predicted nucleic acid-binding protein